MAAFSIPLSQLLTTSYITGGGDRGYGGGRYDNRSGGSYGSERGYYNKDR